MFDLERIKLPVAEYFFKLLHPYRKRKLTEKFIQRWLQLLKMYSKLPSFVTFDDIEPVLKRLQPNARAVLIVPFENTNENFEFSNVSVFPLYPFRVQLVHKSICSKEGLELLLIYLKITEIQLIGFYDVKNYKKVMDALPKCIQFYPPSLFKYFCLKINKDRK